MPKVKKEQVVDIPFDGGKDLMTVEAEEVFPDEQVGERISESLQKVNVTDKLISDLKDKYATLKIDGPDDKEGYLFLQDARKDCKRLRGLVTKVCKKGREWAVLEQKKWVAKEKEVCDKIEEIENPLETQEKAFEAERDRRKAELKQAQDKAFAVRSAELNKFGAIFNGSEYVLGDVAYELSAIRETDDEIYSTIIKPKFEAIFNAKEAARMADEQQKAAADAEREKREADIAAKEKVMKDREDAIIAAEQKLRKENDAKLEAERLAAEVKLKELVRVRVSQLSALGMNYDYNMEIYSAFGTSVSMLDVKAMEENEWNEFIPNITETIKIEKEKSRLAAEAKTQQDAKEAARLAADAAIEKERERVRREKELADKAAEDAKIKAQQEKDAASDSQKWDTMIKELTAIQIPEFKSKKFREQASFVKDFIDGLK